MSTTVSMETQTQQVYPEQIATESILAAQQKKVDDAVLELFNKLNENADLLNDLVKESFKGKEISFMDYIGCVESVYDKFIEKTGLNDLKDQCDYVIGEIFDNSGLGHSLFNQLSDKA